MTGTVNLIKLAVGAKDLHHFASRQKQWYTTYHGQTVMPVWTRRKPREDQALLKGGSLYWVVKNSILCRQEILGIEQIEDEEEGTYCLIFLNTDMYRTDAISRRPFQGWRYLRGSDVPADRGLYKAGDEAEEIPVEMEGDLRDAGLL